MFPFDVSSTQAETFPRTDPVFAYRMRWKRRRLLYRSWKRRKELTRLSGDDVSGSGVLVFSTMRNEMSRVEYWLHHYRELGVAHFLIVDNESDDGTAEFLSKQPDVTVWTTPDSYKISRYGVDWLTCLQYKFGHGRWCLTVDADELLVYPNSEERRLPELVAHLEQEGRDAFGVLMLDMYPKGPVTDTNIKTGENPIDRLCWFDAANYRAKLHPVFSNLWIQGGVRDRLFFGNQPERSPTLNKTPLVKWRRGYAYVTSTHQILPRRLNDVFDMGQGDRVSGVLLHTKFMPNIAEKSEEELRRGQHFENSDLYEPYYQTLTKAPDLWFSGSCEYANSQQLVDLRLMSPGNWE